MKNKALLQVNGAVLLFGLAGLFAKVIGLPSLAITFFRVLFSSMTLALFALIKKQNIKVNKQDLVMLLCSGAILALHWFTFLQSVQVSTVAIGTVTFSTFPLFTMVIEAMYFHKTITKTKVLQALFVMLGVLILCPAFSFENIMFKGIVIGMISALCYALLTICNSILVKKYESFVVTLYEQSFAAIVLLPFMFTITITPSLQDILLLVVLGVFTTAFAHTLFVSSLSKVSTHVAGISSSMESVYSILLAFLILKEVPTIREILGAILIIGVVIYSSVKE